MKYLVTFEIEADESEIEQIIADMHSEILYDNAICLSEYYEVIE